MKTTSLTILGILIMGIGFFLVLYGVSLNGNLFTIGQGTIYIMIGFLSALVLMGYLVKELLEEGKKHRRKGL